MTLGSEGPGPAAFGSLPRRWIIPYFAKRKEKEQKEKRKKKAQSVSQVSEKGRRRRSQSGGLLVIRMLRRKVALSGRKVKDLLDEIRLINLPVLNLVISLALELLVLGLLDHWNRGKRR